MSNSKLRHWIYTAIGFLILCAVAWFVLLRPAKYNDSTVSQIYSERSDALQAVASYLCKLDIPTNITAVPTIDERFGIPVEDSNEYRAYNDGVIELMHTEMDSIRYSNGTVQFVTPENGGLLVPEHAVIAYGEMPPTLSGAPRSDLPGKNWYYYIIEKE